MNVKKCFLFDRNFGMSILDRDVLVFVCPFSRLSLDLFSERFFIFFTISYSLLVINR